MNDDRVVVTGNTFLVTDADGRIDGENAGHTGRLIVASATHESRW